MKRFSTLSDQQLIQTYLNGDVDALSALFVRHKNRLYTLIYLLIKDKYLAEDIFHDTFIKIIDNLQKGKYNDEGNFLAWAMRIAHNMSIDHFRKISRNPPIITNNGSDIFNTFKFSDPGPEEQLLKVESHKSIRKMLESLPEDQIEIIIMRHYTDLSFKEIATITNCSINTALSRMRYGLINLRKMMPTKQITLQSEPMIQNS
jgi:RNA polymerase sigma-70 factor (ECF subfamily)